MKDQEMDELRLRQDAAAAEKERVHREHLVEGKRVLQEQMAERERARELAYQEFLKEKEAIDEIVRKLEDEDERFSSVCVCVCA